MPLKIRQLSLFVLHHPILTLLTIAVLGRLAMPDGTLWLVWLNAATAYLYLPAYLFFALAVWQRQWATAVLAGGIALLHLVWVAPDFLPLRQSIPVTAASSLSLRLFSANLLMVNATPAGILNEIATADPDLILLQEFSPHWEVAFEESGLLANYPHCVGLVRPDSFGTAILSKYPLEAPEVWYLVNTPMTRATVQLGNRAINLLNVHTLPPRRADYFQIWREQMRQLAAMAAQTAEPLVMIGDFNTTQYNPAFQQLVATRLYDAHRAVGRGWMTTFPNNVFPLLPIRLDHALLSDNLVPLHLETGIGQGSDHRPLLIDIALANP